MRVTALVDEISAAGWRLAGATVEVPSAARATSAFIDALEASDLLLVGAEVTGWIDRETLASAQSDTRPLVLVIPALLGTEGQPGIERTVRRALGVEA